MAESALHMNYVRRIVSYLATLGDSLCQIAMVYADLPEYGTRIPKVIDGFFPDVYYNGSSAIIIGEAKSPNDVDNRHTESQIESYIEEVRSYNKSRHIVICVSVFDFAHVKNALVRRKNREGLQDITFHILDNISKVTVI